MIDNLTFEMIKRIVADIGAVPDEAFGTRGLAHSGLALQKTMSIRYDDGAEHEHSIYSGKLLLDQSELRGLLVDLTVDGMYEFLFLFRFQSMPVHAIKVVYGNPEDSFIRIYNDKTENWIIPSVEMTAGLLASFEKFVSWGVLWDECKEVSDLYGIAVNLVD